MGYYSRYLGRTEVEKTAEQINDLTYGDLMDIAGELAMRVSEYVDNGMEPFDPKSETDWAKLLHAWASYTEERYQENADKAEAEACKSRE